MFMSFDYFESRESSEGGLWDIELTSCDLGINQDVLNILEDISSHRNDILIKLNGYFKSIWLNLEISDSSFLDWTARFFQSNRKLKWNKIKTDFWFFDFTNIKYFLAWPYEGNLERIKKLIFLLINEEVYLTIIWWNLYVCKKTINSIYTNPNDILNLSEFSVEDVQYRLLWLENSYIPWEKNTSDEEQEDSSKILNSTPH